MLFKRRLIFKAANYLFGVGKAVKFELIRNKQLRSSCTKCNISNKCFRYTVIGKSKTILKYCMDFEKMYYVSKEGSNNSDTLKISIF